MVQNEDWQAHLDSVTRSGGGAKQALESLELPTLTILAHPDPSRVGERSVLVELVAEPAATVSVSRLEPRFLAPRGGDRPRPLADPRLSRRPWQITRRSDGHFLLDPRQHTSLQLDGGPVTSRRVIKREALRHGVVLLLSGHIVLLFHLLESVSEGERYPGLVGESTAMLKLQREIRQVADLDFPVLLRGESGTGKELVARALHDAGPRRSFPYLAVNIAAIPPTLAAAELFGAVRGAYSGADRNRRGYFHRAQGGTLFLDEIGEASADVQVLLLRALESGQIQPVGADQLQAVNIRIVSATDADLESAVEAGEFRSPLLHRLANYEIALPPLRHRREDFGRLFYHFLAEELGALGSTDRLRAAGPDDTPWVDAEIVDRLVRYSWPGNVRQLKNVVRQLVVGSRGSKSLQVNPKIQRLLEESVGSNPPVESPHPPDPPDRAYRDPDDVDRNELHGVLARNRFEPARAASELGVSRASLYNLMARHQIRRAGDLGREEIEQSLKQHGRDLTAMAKDLQVSKRGLKIRMKDLGLRSGA